MILRRRFCGSEAVEVGITSLVIFAFCIGAVMLFGDSLGKFFQGDASPIIRSAKMGKSSLTSTNANNGIDRTDISKNLATGDVANKLNVASAKSDIVETSGTSGNLKGLTPAQLEKQIAYFYNYGVESGNDMLDAALAAKKAAVSQYNEAAKAVATANSIGTKSTYLSNKVTEQTAYLNQVQANTESLISEYDKVIEHLELLKAMKQSTSDINIGMGQALANVGNVNMDIFNLTNANYSDGNSVLALNQDQIAAYNYYEYAQNLYDTSWQTSCDLFGSCNTYNTSGFTTGDINGFYNQYSTLYSEVKGREAGLKTAVDSAKSNYESFYKAGVDCKDEADKLVGQAKDSLKKAFDNKVDFDNCKSVEDIINKAIDIMGKGSAWVKDKSVAYSAIGLLKSASSNYQKGDYLLSQAKAIKNNLEQKEEVLKQLSANATDLSLQMDKYDTSKMNQTDTTQKSLLTYSENPIAFMENQVIVVNDAKQKSAASEVEQKALIDQLAIEAKQVGDSAAAALKEAQGLQGTANTAVGSAQDLIDEVLKTITGG